MSHRVTVSISFLALFLSACTPTIETRGLDPDHITVEKVSIGKHTKQDVVQNLGTPSSVAPMDENTWYYISRQQETEAFFMPRNMGRKIMTVVFDKSGVVSDVSLVNDDKTPYIKPAEGRTPVAGYESSWSREIFSNLGRMNSKNAGGSAPRVPMPQ